MCSQLKQQLEKMEDRLANEMAARQQIELSKREFEMEQRSTKTANQQVHMKPLQACKHINNRDK